MINPYILPDGDVQIAFSGGRTSGFMLHQIIEANGGLPGRVKVTFHNTGREMPQTLDFVRDCGDRWGVDIVWLEYRYEKPLFEIVEHGNASRCGEPFDAIILKKQALPNNFMKWCSAELKTKTAKRFLVSIGWKSWTTAIGFRADEKHRRAFDDNRSSSWTPLRLAGIGKHDVAAFWKRQPFDLRLPSIRGKTIGGNCDGCFLKSEAETAALCRDSLDRHLWWERHEEETGYRFSDRFSRADLRRYIERQGSWIFSSEGAICQKDGGECCG